MSDMFELQLSVRELRDVELAARIQVARKIGVLVLKKSDGDNDRLQALALARLLIEDTSISVREAIAKELRCCRFLPEDVVKALANDIDQVAVPFLISSQAVPDDMLETLVLNGSSGVQDAIASREDLSEMVAYSICDIADSDAVETLMDNETATVSKRSSKRVVDRFPEHQTLLEKMCKRSDLSPDIAEQIIFKISETYGRYLVERFNLSQDYSSYLVGLSQRQVFNHTLDGARLSEVERYFRQLKRRDALSSDMMLNYLQSEYLRLFMVALSVQLDRPFDTIRQSLADGNKKLLVRLLDKGGYSKSMIGVLSIAYQRIFGKV